MKARLAAAVLWVGLGLAGTAARAAEAAEPSEAQERTRIAQQRSAAQSRFTAKARQCQQQFAVTACVDEARAEHRRTVDDLAVQQRVLDDAARKRRAAQRLAEIEARQKAPPQRVKPERQVVTRDAEAASAPRRLETPHPASAPRRPAAPDPAQQRELEARKRAAFEARQRAAQEHRDESEKRQRDLVKTKPPLAIAPLPVPQAAGSAVPAAPAAPAASAAR